MVTKLNTLRNEVGKSQVGLACLILVLPFTLFLHMFFSDEVHTLTLFIFEIDHEFNNNQGWAWNFLSIIIPLTLMLIWYFTSLDRWRNTILIPIFLYSSRFVIKVFRFSYLEDHEEIILSLLIALCSISLIVLLDVILFRRYRDRRFMIVRLKLFDNKIRRFYNWLNSKMLGSENTKSIAKKKRCIKDLYFTKSLVESEIEKFSKYSETYHLKGKTWDCTFVVSIIVSCAFFLPTN